MKNMFAITKKILSLSRLRRCDPGFRDENVDELLNDTIGNSVLHDRLDHLNEFSLEDVGQERR